MYVPFWVFYFIVLFCVLFCVCVCVCVLYCTVLLPPGVNPSAVNKCIDINILPSYLITLYFLLHFYILIDKSRIMILWYVNPCKRYQDTTTWYATIIYPHLIFSLCQIREALHKLYLLHDSLEDKSVKKRLSGSHVTIHPSSELYATRFWFGSARWLSDKHHSLQWKSREFTRISLHRYELV